jgi:hypothetical protein
MEEVSRLSGAQVRWLSQDGEEPVSVEFTALPLPEALRRILGEKNFMLFYASVGGEKRLAQIWISSSRKGGGRPVLTPPANNPALQVRETASQGRDEPDSVPLNMITQTAPNDENPASRLEFIELLATQAGEDPQARALLSHIAHSDSDPYVRDTASAMLGGIECTPSSEGVVCSPEGN